MNVQELRDSEHIESVEEDTIYEWSDKVYWKAKTRESLCYTEQGVAFLCRLDIRWEEPEYIYLNKGKIEKE